VLFFVKKDTWGIAEALKQIKIELLTHRVPVRAGSVFYKFTIKFQGLMVTRHLELHPFPVSSPFLLQLDIIEGDKDAAVTSEQE
jgi:hypothetical protein